MFIPDPPSGSALESAAARMCTDFNTDKCGTKTVDEPPIGLRVGTDKPSATVVPNQVRS